MPKLSWPPAHPTPQRARLPHPKLQPDASTGKFSQRPRGTNLGTGARFCERQQTKSSIPGSPGIPRKGAPVPHSASQTVAPGSEALGGGCTTPSRKDEASALSPFPSGTSLSSIGAPRAGRGRKGAATALGSPPPRAVADSRRGSPGLPRLPQSLPSGDLGTRGARRGERRAAEAKEPGRAPEPRPRSRRSRCWRAPPTHCAGWGRGVPYLGKPQESGERQPAVPGIGAQPGFGAHAAYGCTIPVPSAHPSAGAQSASGARTISGALSLAGSAWAWGAHPAGHTHRGRCRAGQAPPAEASSLVAGCQHHRSRRLRQGEKKKNPDAARALGV